jgi:predicted transglutaminase-like cysteine proteinase
MRPTFLPFALTAPMMTLAVLNSQPALAFNVPAKQCAGPAQSESAPVAAPATEGNMLDAIRLQQEGKLIAPRPAVELAEVALPFLMTSCVERSEPGLGVAQKPAAPVPEQHFTTTDRPDVFGSVALPVSHTPLDTKWRAAYQARLSAHSGPWMPLVRGLIGKGRIQQLDAVNQWVNQRVHFTNDRRGRHEADQWASASETLRSSRGDCEDYAIAKMKLLEAAGVARADMYLVIANDLVRRADHALLVVRVDQRFMVLDSSSNQLLDAAQVSDYRPVFSYGKSGAWVHGYLEKPIQVASSL